MNITNHYKTERKSEENKSLPESDLLWPQTLISVALNVSTVPFSFYVPKLHSPGRLLFSLDAPMQRLTFRMSITGKREDFWLYSAFIAPSPLSLIIIKISQNVSCRRNNTEEENQTAAKAEVVSSYFILKFYIISRETFLKGDLHHQQRDPYLGGEQMGHLELKRWT